MKVHPSLVGLVAALLLFSAPAWGSGLDAGAASPSVHIHYLHDADASVQLQRGAARQMDGARPATSNPPFGATYHVIGELGNGDGQRLRWLSPPVSELVEERGTLLGFDATAWVFASLPGYQPADQATLHVELHRVAVDGTTELVAASARAVPQLLLNQMTRLDTGTTIEGVELAAEDRLLAEFYVTGLRTTTVYMSYDDRTLASRVDLHLVEEQQ